MSNKAILALENGAVFYGESIGVAGTSVGELVFNTSHTGYQEIITDPSYANQFITFTYPHIGNTGINSEDFESKQIWADAVIVRNYSNHFSNWRANMSLKDFLVQENKMGITGIDTRQLTTILREHGSLKACLSTNEFDINTLINKAKNFVGTKDQDLAKIVSTKTTYEWKDGLWDINYGYNKISVDEHLVVAIDFGVKKNILRHIKATNAKVLVVPYNTSYDDIINLNPDGIFLSNGPGDPKACSYAIDTVSKLLPSNIPIFGICLGYQILALACGAKSYKMKFGHHGANHPITDIDKTKVYITSQNHNYAIASDLPKTLSATHFSLFDNSLQGIKHNVYPAFGLQGHPESSPGPHDQEIFFQQFAKMVRAYKKSAKKHVQIV